MVAATSGHRACLRVLLARAPETVDAQDHDGWSALLHACATLPSANK